MKNNKLVDIVFYLDQKMFGARLWPKVPRVGDEIMLGPKDDITGQKTAYKIMRVIWGVENENSVYQSVNIEIKKIL